MSNLGALNIQLSLDTVQFQQALSKSDHQTQKFVKNFTVDMDKARNSARQFADRTTDYLRNIESAAKNINTTTKWEFRINNFERVQALASSFIQIADKSTELSNKLKLVTDDEIQHARAMASVYDISMKTAQSTQAVSAIYASFSQNAKELGINQQQVASVTETISKAVSISGASASEAQNALTQFSQTLLMGKMRAQEYNSIMTQTPAVMQAIARGLGVTMGELKQMSDDGKLTSDKMIQALEKSKASVDDLYSKTATTVSASMQNLQTATQKWVGDVDKSIGVSDKAVKVTQFLAENLDMLAKAAVGVGVAYGSIKLGAVFQSQYNSIKAIQAETTARHQQLASLTQETQATYTAQLATYQSIQAKQADVVATQAQVQAEQAKLRVLALSATSYAERRIIQTQLQALDKVSAELSQKQIFLDQQQATAKQALNVAYRENAMAQSAFVVSTQASGVAMTAFSRITAGVKAEMNALKIAMMSNPIMLGLTVLTTAASMIYMFSSSTDEATQSALRYVDSIEQVRANLEKMSAAQVAAEMVKVKQSIHEQEESVANLKEEYKRLADEANSAIDIAASMSTGFAVYKTADEMAKANDALTLKTAELEEAENKLNKTLEWQRDLQAHENVSQIRDQIVALYPELENATFSNDKLTTSVGSYALVVPQATDNTSSLIGKIHSLANNASVAAIAVAELKKQMGGGGEIIDPKNLKMIEQIERRNAIGLANGKDKVRLQVEDAMINSGLKEVDPGYERMKAAYQAQFEQQAAKSLARSGGAPKTPKPKKTAKDKSEDKTKREAEKPAKKQADDAKKNREDYLNQVANMSQKLASLKAEATDIALFGQTSQYQDVKRLTEDIALNAEKYKGYGVEGVAKLKEMATQIDSENQKIAIAQFSASNGEKLKEMEFELTLLGKTRQEQELMQYNHQLDMEAAKLKVGMTEENIAKLDEEIAKLKERRTEIQIQSEQAKASWENGMKQGWNNIEADVSDVAGNIANLTQNAFDGMTNAMTDFVMTGKADFKSFAESIVRDISNMIIKMMLFRAIQASLGGTSFGNFLGIPISSAAQGGLIGSVSLPKVMLGGFSRGGYTGDGGKYVPAGLVHRGEYVITKEATARLGLDFLNHLNYGKRGFSSGGGVAVPRLPSVPTQIPAQKQSSSIQLTQHYTIDARGADHGVEQRISDLLKQNKRETIAEIRNQIRRGGQFGKDFGVA